jgi:hypothetical protein
MIIHLERTGGFTGIPLRAVIDSATLDPAESRDLLALVESAGFFALPAQVRAPQPGPDRFQYVLTIEDTQRSHTVEIDETVIPAQLEPLLQQVTLLARKTRRIP